MGKYDKQVKEILSVTAVTILCTAATENKIDGQKMKDLSQELDPKVGGKHQKRGERSDDVEMREVLSDWYEQGLCDMKRNDALRRVVDILELPTVNLRPIAKELRDLIKNTGDERQTSCPANSDKRRVGSNHSEERIPLYPSGDINFNQY